MKITEIKKHHLQPKKKKIHIANEILFFFFGLLYSLHRAESAIHNALSTPSGFLRRESIERDVVREIIGSFELCSFESETQIERGEYRGWID